MNAHSVHSHAALASVPHKPPVGSITDNSAVLQGFLRPPVQGLAIDPLSTGTPLVALQCTNIQTDAQSSVLKAFETAHQTMPDA